MDNQDHLSILNEPLRLLIFTDYFVDRATAMGFNTIQDIIDRDEDDTAKHPEFTWKWFDELIMFLHKRGMVKLLDDPQRIEKHRLQKIQKNSAHQERHFNLRREG